MSSDLTPRDFDLVLAVEERTKKMLMKTVDRVVKDFEKEGNAELVACGIILGLSRAIASVTNAVGASKDGTLSIVSETFDRMSRKSN